MTIDLVAKWDEFWDRLTDDERAVVVADVESGRESDELIRILALRHAPTGGFGTIGWVGQEHEPSRGTHLGLPELVARKARS